MLLWHVWCGTLRPAPHAVPVRGGKGRGKKGKKGRGKKGKGRGKKKGKGAAAGSPPSPGAPPGGARPPALSRRLPAAAPGEVPRVVRGFPLAVPAPGGNPKRPRREAGAALCGSGGASELAKRVSPPVSDPRRWRCASPPERRRLYRVVDRQGGSRVFLARVGATGRCRVPVFDDGTVGRQPEPAGAGRRVRKARCGASGSGRAGMLRRRGGAVTGRISGEARVRLRGSPARLLVPSVTSDRQKPRRIGEYFKSPGNKVVNVSELG